VGYQLNGTDRSSVWVTIRVEKGGFQFRLPVEWNREVFSVGYRSNGTYSSSVWVTL